MSSWAMVYPVNGYQDVPAGEFVPIEVVAYYVSKQETLDWQNMIVPLALSSLNQQSRVGVHGWTDGEYWQDIFNRAPTQSLSMQYLYDLHGKDPLPEHPVYSNAELTNIVYVGNSLAVDPTAGDPHRVPDGVWYHLLNGGNINGWNLVVQEDPNLWIPGWPYGNPRDAEVQERTRRGKKKK